MSKHPDGLEKKDSIGKEWVNIQVARSKAVQGARLTPGTARRQYFGRKRPVKFDNTMDSNRHPKTKPAE